MKCTPIRRRSRLRARKRMKARNPERRAREFDRAYGGSDHVDWMKRHDCLTCRAEGPSDCSHLRSRAGMGRKGDWQRTVPQCRTCHDLYPRRSKWRARFPHWTDEKLEAAAAVFAARWLEYMKVEFAF